MVENFYKLKHEFKWETSLLKHFGAMVHATKGKAVDIETLEEIKKSADLNPVVQMLRLRGPGGLVLLVRDQAKKDGAPFVPPQTEEKRDLCSLCKYVITNPNNARALQRAVRDPKVYHEIARESLQEFGETSMFYENLYSVADEINDEMIAESIADSIADTVADSMAD